MCEGEVPGEGFIPGAARLQGSVVSSSVQSIYINLNRHVRVCQNLDFPPGCCGPVILCCGAAAATRLGGGAAGESQPPVRTMLLLLQSLTDAAALELRCL